MSVAKTTAKSKDEFGDRMKAYERQRTSETFIPLLPIYARLDGRGFSRFTRGFNKPFDQILTRAMYETAAELLTRTHARIVYTQSDEISLVWQQEDYGSETFFARKVQKMVSVLPSLAAALFMRYLSRQLLAVDALPKGLHPVEVLDRMPHFDCRVFQLPNRAEATNAFLWRCQDAQRNAVQMVAQSHFSHRELHGVSIAGLHGLLAAKGVTYSDFHPSNRFGTFLRREQRERFLSETEVARLRAKRGNEELPRDVSVVRAIVADHYLQFNAVTNREAFIFEGAEPEYATEIRPYAIA